jgi:hypothetical protein
MIKFTLACEHAHQFESWFPDNASYEEQARRGFVVCPECDSHRVAKAPMAPAVLTRRRNAPAETPAQPTALLDEKAKALREAMGALRREIEARTDDVGTAFAGVARAMHAGETPERAIRGKADFGEVKALLEDGIRVAPIPMLPDEAN